MDTNFILTALVSNIIVNILKKRDFREVYIRRRLPANSL